MFRNQPHGVLMNDRWRRKRRRNRKIFWIILLILVISLVISLSPNILNVSHPYRYVINVGVVKVNDMDEQTIKYRVHDIGVVEKSRLPVRLHSSIGKGGYSSSHNLSVYGTCVSYSPGGNRLLSFIQKRLNEHISGLFDPTLDQNLAGSIDRKQRASSVEGTISDQLYHRLHNKSPLALVIFLRNVVDGIKATLESLKEEKNNVGDIIMRSIHLVGIKLVVTGTGNSPFVFFYPIKPEDVRDEWNTNISTMRLRQGWHCVSFIAVYYNDSERTRMPSFHTSKSTLKLNGCLFGSFSVVSVAPDSPHHASEFGVTPWQLPLSGGVPSEPADDTDLRDSIVTDSDDGNDANHPVLLAPRSVLEGHPMIFAVVPSAFHNELNFYPSSLHDHLSRGMKEGTSYSVHNTNLARDAIRSFRTRVFGSGAPIGFSPDTNSNPESKEERHYPYPLLYSVSQTVKGGSFWGHPDLKRGKDKNKDYIRGTNMDRRLFFDSERDVEMLEDFTSETRWRLPDSVTRDLSAAICRSSRRTGKGGYDKAECSQALSRIKVREIPRGNHGAPVVTSVDELRKVLIRSTTDHLLVIIIKPPYNTPGVIHDLIIGDGEEITVPPGVSIYFSAYSRIVVKKGGRLHVGGHPSRKPLPDKMLSSTPATVVMSCLSWSDGWGGIVVKEGGRAIIQHTSISCTGSKMHKRILGTGTHIKSYPPAITLAPSSGQSHLAARETARRRWTSLTEEDVRFDISNYTGWIIDSDKLPTGGIPETSAILVLRSVAITNGLGPGLGLGKNSLTVIRGLVMQDLPQGLECVGCIITMQYSIVADIPFVSASRDGVIAFQKFIDEDNDGCYFRGGAALFDHSIIANTRDDGIDSASNKNDPANPSFLVLSNSIISGCQHEGIALSGSSHSKRLVFVSRTVIQLCQQGIENGHTPLYNPYEEGHLTKIRDVVLLDNQVSIRHGDDYNLLVGGVLTGKGVLFVSGVSPRGYRKTENAFSALPVLDLVKMERVKKQGPSDHLNFTCDGCSVHILLNEDSVNCEVNEGTYCDTGVLQIPYGLQCGVPFM